MKPDAKNDRAAWLRGPESKCCVPPKELDRPWRLVLLGAPGVGKGTQAELLSERLNGCHLSTGDVFRAASSPCCGGRTPAMEAALQHMRSGQLVPDATVWEIVRERSGCIRCAGGFVLDGFPRTLGQAEAFSQLLKEEGLSLDAVIDYVLPEAELLTRLSGRRVCEKCKAIFHVRQKPPKVQGVCDHCGGNLIQREDDREESVKVRLETYQRETAPLIDYYRKRKLLMPIAATGAPADVFGRTLHALETALIDGLLRSRNPHDAMVGMRSRHGEPRCGEERL